VISRIMRRVRRVVSGPAYDPLAWKRNGAPLFGAMTHDHRSDFFLPPLAGASTFADACTSANTVREVQQFILGLSRDEHVDFLNHFYSQGLERFGDEWRFADINTVLWALASRLPVRRYMEIGVRRGKSLSIIAHHRPDSELYCFDMWVPGYAGMENPGKDFVRSELQRTGYRGSAQFFDGDSSLTVPHFVEAWPDIYFDLITVDGDHSVDGARRDLLNVIPRLSIGGIVVFDDTASQYHPELGTVWRAIVGDPLRFSTFAFNETGFGISFAIRKQ
jgi:predicted O-methyltransferase YrrM